MNQFTLKYPKLSGLIIFVITTVLLFVAGVLLILTFGGSSPKSPSGQPTGSLMAISFILGIVACASLPIGAIVGVLSSVFFVRRKNRMP